MKLPQVGDGGRVVEPLGGSGQEVSAAPGTAAGNQHSSRRFIQKILDKLLNPAITA